LLPRDAPGVACGAARQFERVAGRMIRERAPLEAAPDVLGGVQLRCAGRQQDRMHLRAAVQERAGRAGTLGRKPVPDQDRGTADVAAQRAEEVAHHRCRDVRVRIEGAAEPEPAALRRVRNHCGLQTAGTAMAAPPTMPGRVSGARRRPPEVQGKPPGLPPPKVKRPGL